MTVVERVVFSAIVDVKAYTLTELDALGKSWDASRWVEKGEGELRMLEVYNGGNLRCVIKGSGLANKDKLLTNHLIHPESYLKTTEDGKGRMLWVQDASEEKEQVVDTCLELIFAKLQEAMEFEKQYKNCQEKMARLHESTEHEWRRVESEEPTNSSVTEEEPAGPGIVSGAKMQNESTQEDQPQTEEGSEAPETSSEEEEEDDDDSSECSEISLDVSDDEEEGPKRTVVFPPFAEQKSLWKCLACTTPNPESAVKCLCCEVPRGEKKMPEKKEGERPGPVVLNFGKQDTGNRQLFNFSGTPTSTTSFTFSAPSSQDKSSNPEIKPTFSFGSSSSGGFSFTGSSAFVSEGTNPFSASSFTFKDQNGSAESSIKSPFQTQEKAGQENGKSSVEAAKLTNVQPSKSPYPPMETMKKVEQMIPGQTIKPSEDANKSQTQVGTKSPYPPMETMKKVEQKIPGQTTEPADEISTKQEGLGTKIASSPYPPMESMKKVEQVIPGAKQESSFLNTGSTSKEEKATTDAFAKVASKSSAYPPMETMKKVDQFVPGASKEEKEKTDAKIASRPPTYPPMETMKKVDQFVPGAPRETKKDTSINGLSADKNTSFGSAIPSSNAANSPFNTGSAGSLFKTSSDSQSPGLFQSAPTFGSSTFGSSSSSLSGATNDKPNSLFSSSNSSGLFGAANKDATTKKHEENASSFDTGDLKTAVTIFYKKYKPENLDKVDSLLQKFKGKENTLIENLAKKYSLSQEEKSSYFGKVTFHTSTSSASFGSSFFGNSFSSSLPTLKKQEGSATEFKNGMRSGSQAGSESSEDETEEGEKEQSGGAPFHSTVPVFSEPTLFSSSSSFSSPGTGFQTKQPTSSIAFGAPSFGTPLGGSSGGISFGQSSTLGASPAGAFGNTSAPKPTQTISTASPFTSGSGFAAFASPDQSSGFGSLGKGWSNS